MKNLGAPPAGGDHGKLKRIFLAVILIAFALRIWGIWFGFPYLYQSDEPNEVLRALRLGMGDFDFSRTAKGGYFYLLFVEYGIFFVVLKLFNVVKGVLDFAYFFVREPWPFYLIGRVTTAVLGTLTVVFTYRLGTRTYGKVVGLAAAGFLAVDQLHVRYSHYATVDVPMTLLVVISILFACRILEDGKRKNYILAGLFTGLAAMTKLPGGLVVLPVFLAHCFTVKREGGGLRAFFLEKRLFLYGAVAALVFLAGNPGFLVHIADNLKGVLRIFADTGTGGGFVDTGELRPPPNRFLYYLDSLADSMGWALFAIAVLGLFYAFLKRRQTDIMFGSFVTVFFLMLALSKHPSSTTRAMSFP